MLRPNKSNVLHCVNCPLWMSSDDIGLADKVRTKEGKIETVCPKCLGHFYIIYQRPSMYTDRISAEYKYPGGSHWLTHSDKEKMDALYRQRYAR